METLSIPQKLKNLIIFSIISLGLDQYTKFWAVEKLKGTPGFHYIQGHLRIIYAENPGAWGNLGAEWGDTPRFLFLILIPILVLIGFGVHSVLGKKIRKYDSWAFCLVVSGGAGNLIDRVLHGHVVDMLWFGFPNSWFQTNIFNVADVSIMIGFGILVILGIVDSRNAKKEAETNSTK